MTENKTAMVVSAHWADFGITPVWEKKYAAFKMADKRIFRTTPKNYSERVALQRGTQGCRSSGRSNIKYGEAYQRIFPQVTDVFE
jgi:hypothetical protein